MATISGAFLEKDLDAIYGHDTPDGIAISDLLISKYDQDPSTPLVLDSPPAIGTSTKLTLNASYHYDNGSNSLNVSNSPVGTTAASKTFVLADAFDDALLTNRAGAKALVGNDQDNILGGNNFANVITGGLGNDTIFAGGGNDTINYNLATDGADIIYSGNGQDIVNLSSTDATQIRLAFNSENVGDGSFFYGDFFGQNQTGALAVAVQSEDGSNGLTGSIGHVDDEGVTIVAATGTTFDIHTFDNHDASVTSIGDQFARAYLGTQGIDKLTGTAGNDYINGGAGNDVLVGGVGNDYIDTGSGNNTVVDGLGDDTIIGGVGNDVISSGLTIFKTGTDNDTINAGDGNNKVLSGFGNDSIDAGTGRDTIDGGAGNDTIHAGSNNDSVIGGTGDDSIDGETGRDVLNGGAGNDIINGGDGGDTIIGGDGNDIISGGAGSDLLTGGKGDDVFIINGATDGTGIDVITDFTATTTGKGLAAITTSDTLQITGHGGADFTFNDFEASSFPDPSVKGVFISFNDGGSVLLKNVDIHDLVFDDATDTFSLLKHGSPGGNVPDAGG